MPVSSRGVVRSVVLIVGGLIVGGLIVLGGCSDREDMINQQSPSCTQAPGYVVFAHHSLWLRAGSTTTGKVGVRDATSSPYVGDNAELTVGLATAVTGDVVADSVRLRAVAHVTGDVRSNDRVQGLGATIDGAHISPLSLPLPDITPPMPAFQPGSQNVTVPTQSTHVLATGDYATIVLAPGTQAAPTVLQLAGTYNLQILDMGFSSRVECTAACEMRIKDRLLGGFRAYIGPASGTSLTAGDVRVFVEGVNGSAGGMTDVPKAAAIGLDNEVRAHVFAPNGTLRVLGDSVVRGVFIGKWVEIGIGVQATVEDPLEEGGTDGGVDGAMDGGAPPVDLAPPPDVVPSADVRRPDSCVPTSCAALGATCGTVADGCGGSLDCGSCTLPETCGGGGLPNTCGCTPTTCAALGATCGTLADGCGGTLDCGSCVLPETCGGGGVPNTCGCTATSCAVLGATCGTVADGCGGTLDCGSCVLPDTCGGGGVPNTCGCTATSCAALGASCGTVADGCGGTLDCGSCVLPDTCGGGGVPNTCGCAVTTCAALGATCGTVADGCGGTLDCGSCVLPDTCGGAGTPNVCGVATPPDPASVAPPLDDSVATTTFDATAFLYTGPDPIQTGVAPGTIDPGRAGLIRGRVLDTDNAARPGVGVSIVDHPELGGTVSRQDGGYDLVVNGGGQLTVRYAAPGLLASDRQVVVPWQAQLVLEDVILVAPDPQVTAVQSLGLSMQVARGQPVTDSSGTRQATLLFPTGTAATMVMPDGSTQPLALLNVRATEFTVGPLGPQRMPADLPPNVAYTYAVELGVDEAVAAGARHVTFSIPVALYLENFLDFPVGQTVPLGSYDRQQAVWVPATSGRIVQILSVTGGLADLDLDGSGLAAGATELEALGITDEERGRLTTLYAVGQSLWRVAVTHFTDPWDLNWAWAGTPPDPPPAPIVPPPPPPTPCTWPIECQSQALKDRVAVTGTPLSLVYRSDRVPGRSDAVLQIPLTGPLPPTGLKRVELQVAVAGRLYQQSFGPAAGQSHTFLWDGRDAYGRRVQGKWSALVRLGYVLDGTYMAGLSFGGSGGAVLNNNLRQERTYWFYSRARIGHLEAPARNLGGWSLDAVHTYDPVGRDLYLGDGRMRKADSRVVTRVHHANSVEVQANDVAVDAQGRFYVVHSGTWYPNQVIRVDRDGTVVRVAGDGSLGFYGGFSGDGGPATAAKLRRPYSVVLDAKGNLYIADTGNQRIRRVDAVTGIITTVAGNGTYGFGGDGGPATAAALRDPSHVAVDGAGNLYIADAGNNRIRKVGPDGVIWTVAGNGASYGSSGDGGPATSAPVVGPRDVDVDAAGTIYIAQSGASLRRVRPDGIIETIASPWVGCSPNDGVPLSAACVSAYGVAVGPAGALYIVDGYGLGSPNRRVIRRVEVDGTVSTVAGGGTVTGYAAKGQPARKVYFMPSHIAVDSVGQIYSAPAGNPGTTGGQGWGVFRVSPTLPGYSGTDVALVSEDGRELYRFSPQGRHLSTVSTRTGATLSSMGYDGTGALLSVTDGDGNVTTVQRDGSGAPAAIVGPFGQSTTLGRDANGWLSSITSPAAETTSYGYTAGGLMTSKTTPRGHGYSFTHDPLGRITHYLDPSGGSKTLALTQTGADVYSVSVTTSEGRTTTYGVELLPGAGTAHTR